MADGEDSRIVELRPQLPAQSPARSPVPPMVAFHRTELSQILRVYGRMVAAGEWRDYAMDFGREQAVFSIFRRMGEVPMYRVTKTPKLSKRQGMWAVVSGHGLILKRGHDLDSVLKVFDRRRLSVVGE
ncbi:DUF2794 domain-containing protein [Acuticoccus sediminis]|uniref:DUF2794 domain-containing protein n=1 Tax=Acuticoccus sediminis TaxID=2184697 RepID=A0A8B2NI50_9HYPH|nr:DUF2794 domain-containing protein [Acuticoccus sediminis]RAH97083.1 DUF2794 domain-containing protein [Acuticoccus sediminis]